MIGVEQHDGTCQGVTGVFRFENRRIIFHVSVQTANMTVNLQLQTFNSENHQNLRYFSSFNVDDEI